MIHYKTGDILEEQADALVNTVNCEGFMGRGIALQFKKAWPENFKAYEAACRRKEVQPGRMFVFETGRLGPPRFIINFPTKRHWRGKSRMEDIEAGLTALVSEIRRREIRSIAIPPLGAGLGGLAWADVRSQIVHAMEELEDVQVIVFEPSGSETRAIAHKGAAPSMSPGRAALVGLMNRYVRALLDPFITLLEVQKLMYFMQEGGEPLRLKFVKGPYGPYAENLRHVLTEIEGHFVTGYGDGGDAPDKTLEIVPGAVEGAETALAGSPDTRARFEQVAQLVDGFESSFGMELLATVHWVMTRENANTEEETVARVYGWADRKRQFKPHQIALARRVLGERGWLSRSPQ